jgi:hypothetical protein
MAKYVSLFLDVVYIRWISRLKMSEGDLDSISHVILIAGAFVLGYLVKRSLRQKMS